MSQSQGSKAKTKHLLESNLEVDSHASNSKLARALGSCDFHTREKGVAALTRFLQKKTELSVKDMLKIWKGLFYAFWHSDKDAVQTELAERLSKIMSSLKQEVAFLYFTCFVRSIRREWFGIDRLRLDKFLMLIRKFIFQMFVSLAAKKWQDDMVDSYMHFLTDHLLMPVSDTYRAVGVAYHVGDLYIQELKNALYSVGRSGAPSGVVLRQLLDPFCKVLEKSDEKIMLMRIREGVFDALLQEIRSPEEGQPLRELDVKSLGTDLFNLGALPETKHRNREVLYAVSDVLESSAAKRLKKEAGVSGPVQTPEVLKQSSSKKQREPLAIRAVDPSSTEQPEKGKKKRKAAQVFVEDDPSTASATPSALKVPVVSPSVVPGPKSSGLVSATHTSGKKAKLLPRGSDGSGAAESDKALDLKAGPSLSSLKGTKTGSKGKRSLDGEVAEPLGMGGQLTPVTGKGSGSKQEQRAQGLGAPPSALKTGGKSVAKSGKKKVHINLKHNLYFDFGGPVPPAEVRTPARSKGGILKVTSPPGTAPAKVGLSSKADLTAPKRECVSASKIALPSNNRGGRPRAALFF